MPDSSDEKVWHPDIKVLILEDDAADAELTERTLRRAGHLISTRRVETKETFAAALDEFAPDIVLADFRLPDFDGLSALVLAHTRYPDLPVIIVTGVLSDEAAVELIKAGANDYVLKDRLSRLPAAVERALSEAASSAALRKQKAATRSAEARIEAIANYAHDAIIMMNSEGAITFWNRSAERLFGYSSAEAVGQSLHSLLAPEEDAPYVRQGLEAFARTGKGPIVGKAREVTALSKSGTSVRVEMSISAIEVEGKWSAIGVLRDVRDRPVMIQL